MIDGGRSYIFHGEESFVSVASLISFSINYYDVTNGCEIFYKLPNEVTNCHLEEQLLSRYRDELRVRLKINGTFTLPICCKPKIIF